ncbi:MFS-type transporter [Paramyrothecium foliicola]|nr:MFS-type transporter [Paramyrothecium foliicola]
MSLPPFAVDVPGTVQLVDVEGVFNVKHGTGQPNIVLVPQPSNDPHDPLSWDKRRKSFTIFWAMTWCFFAAAIISGLSPAYLQIEADTGISVADLSTGNGILYLFLGWGTLITQSLALNYGRRPVLVFSIVAMTFINLWSAYIESRSEFFVNRIIMGVVSSPMETLIEVIIDDLYFVHQRGFYMGIYSWTLWSGALLSPVASGFVAEALGWRWIQYILSIIGAATAILTSVFFEETMFYRAFVQAPGGSTLETKSGMLEAEAAYVENMQARHPCNHQGSSLNSGHMSDGINVEEPASTNYTRERTSWSKLKLWGFRDTRKPSHFKVFLLPFRLLQFPTVLFSGLLVGGILSWYNVVGGSLALILGNAPYNFGSNVIGLFYVASVIGVTIGCLISGWASDALSIWMSGKHSGVMEPEHRLWLFIVAIVAHPCGCLLYGVGASYHIHWIGIAIGLGIISVTMPLGTSLAFTYVLDSFKAVAGEGFVSIILIRNTMGEHLPGKFAKRMLTSSTQVLLLVTPSYQ